MPDRSPSCVALPRSSAPLPRTPQVGDRLIITGGYGKREPRTGTVANVRRRYMAVEIDGVSGRWGVVDFDIETGRERMDANSNGHYAQLARTPEWAEYDDRLSTARQVLSDHGLRPSFGVRGITDEQTFAIAAILEPAADGSEAVHAGAHDVPIEQVRP